MKNNPELNTKLKQLNNYYKVFEILHEISLMQIPDNLALEIYEIAKKTEELNY